MEGEVTEVTISGHRFQIYARDLAYVIATFLSVVGLYFIANNRINILEREVNDMLVTIRQIDQNGTKRSHEKDEMQQQQIDYNAQQISDLSRTMRDLTPKVDKIDTNVLWLMAKQLEHK